MDESGAATGAAAATETVCASAGEVTAGASWTLRAFAACRGVYPETRVAGSTWTKRSAGCVAMRAECREFGTAKHLRRPIDQQRMCSGR
jgi:hypothetical protein